VGELKRKLAQKFKTGFENVIVSHGDIELSTSESDTQPIRECLKLNDKSIVKVNFKARPSHLVERSKVIKVKKRIMQPMVEVNKGDQTSIETIKEPGFLEQYMSYQDQMNHRHPQKRKIILPKSVDLVKKSSTPQAAQSPHASLFSSAAGKSSTKTEAWKQAIQRLNNETNKAALTSHLGSRLGDRRISEPSFLINRSSVDH